MIEALSGWAEQIIVAVILATMIEMLLPSGNNKKYIKTVIGVYILFTILSPILGKITNFNLKEINFEEYFNTNETYQAMSDNLSTQNNQSVEEIYIANLKQDMTQKLKEKGYLPQKITIKLDLTEGKNYGRVNAIYLNIGKQTQEETQETNTVTQQVEISKVEKVSVGNTLNTHEKKEVKKDELSSNEKKEIKKYLSSVYEVKEKNIEINQ